MDNQSRDKKGSTQELNQSNKNRSGSLMNVILNVSKSFFKDNRAASAIAGKTFQGGRRGTFAFNNDVGMIGGTAAAAAVAVVGNMTFQNIVSQQRQEANIIQEKSMRNRFFFEQDSAPDLNTIGCEQSAPGFERGMHGNEIDQVSFAQSDHYQGQQLRGQTGGQPSFAAGEYNGINEMRMIMDVSRGTNHDSRQTMNFQQSNSNCNYIRNGRSNELPLVNGHIVHNTVEDIRHDPRFIPKINIEDMQHSERSQDKNDLNSAPQTPTGLVASSFKCSQLSGVSAYFKNQTSIAATALGEQQQIFEDNQFNEGVEICKASSLAQSRGLTKIGQGNVDEKTSLFGNNSLTPKLGGSSVRQNGNYSFEKAQSYFQNASELLNMGRNSPAKQLSSNPVIENCQLNNQDSLNVPPFSMQNNSLNGGTPEKQQQPQFYTKGVGVVDSAVYKRQSSSGEPNFSGVNNYPHSQTHEAAAAAADAQQQQNLLLEEVISEMNPEYNLEKLKIKQSRQFASQYMRLMSILFSIIIIKRIFLDEKSDVTKLAFHLTVIGLFMIMLRIHSSSDLATRLVPLLIGCLSYYGHTQYLLLLKGVVHSSEEVQTNAQRDLRNLNYTSNATVLQREDLLSNNSISPEYCLGASGGSTCHFLNLTDSHSSSSERVGSTKNIQFQSQDIAGLLSSTLFNSIISGIFTETDLQIINPFLQTLPLILQCASSQLERGVEGICKNITSQVADILTSKGNNTISLTQNKRKDKGITDINEVMRTIVIFGAFFINHIYIDIFLTVKQVDSLILNLTTWGLFLFNLSYHPEVYTNTQLSVLTLAIFSLKFANDARKIKDQILQGFTEQRSINQQWIRLFKKLPVGIVISNGKQVLHTNRKMREITGMKKIKNLEDLDQCLQIQKDKKKGQMGGGLPTKDCNFDSKRTSSGHQSQAGLYFKPMTSGKVRGENSESSGGDKEGLCKMNGNAKQQDAFQINPKHSGQQSCEESKDDRPLDFETFSQLLNPQYQNSTQYAGQATKGGRYRQTQISGCNSPSYIVNQSSDRYSQSSSRMRRTGSIQNKLVNGDSTFTFIVQNLVILGVKMKLIMFVDITQQERQYKASLEQKYKNIFLSSVSHQLRTPLNILQLNNNILRDVLKENALAMNILEDDHKTQELLNYQIADILDYSKIEADDFKTNFSEFNFNDLLRKLRNIFEPMATQKKLFFNMSINDQVPTFVYQDEQRLGQILVNIIGNAVKFTFNGTVTIQVEINQRLNEIKVVVRDTGRGIEKLHHIGQFFGNLEVIENVNQNGIGFGITISKRLIQKLGGQVYFQNVHNGVMGSVHQICGLQVSIVFPWQQPKNPFMYESTSTELLRTPNNLISPPIVEEQVFSYSQLTDKSSKKGPPAIKNINKDQALKKPSFLSQLNSGCSQTESNINDASPRIAAAQQSIEGSDDRNVVNKKWTAASGDFRDYLQSMDFKRKLLSVKKRTSKLPTLNKINKQGNSIVTEVAKKNNSKFIILPLPLDHNHQNEQHQQHNKEEKKASHRHNHQQSQASSKLTVRFNENGSGDEFEDEATIEQLIFEHTTKEHKTLAEKLRSEENAENSVVQEEETQQRLCQGTSQEVKITGFEVNINTEQQPKVLFLSEDRVEGLMSPSSQFYNEMMLKEKDKKKGSIKRSMINYHKRISANARRMIRHGGGHSSNFLKGRLISHQIIKMISQIKHMPEENQNKQQNTNNNNSVHLSDIRSSANFQPALKKHERNHHKQKGEVRTNHRLEDIQSRKRSISWYNGIGSSGGPNPSLMLNSQKKNLKSARPMTSAQEMHPIRRHTQKHAGEVDDAANVCKFPLLPALSLTEKMCRTPKEGSQHHQLVPHVVSSAQNCVPQIPQTVSVECCTRILIVDDNPFNVKSIELMLEHCFKLKCDVAYSGAEALKLVEKRLEKLHKFGCSEYYKLILTDINMPEMDGIQMTKKIRQCYHENAFENPPQLNLSQLQNHQHVNGFGGSSMRKGSCSLSRAGSNIKVSNIMHRNQPVTVNDCVIWAITAMNESDILDMVGNDCLNGISVKPMSYKQLSEILFAQNLINFVVDNN